MTTAVAMGTLQVATLPTHDPVVGRIVGSVFASQAGQNKPEKALLEGTINGKDTISLTYARAADGSVTADGKVGGIEVHERFESVQVQEAFPSPRLFGVGSTAEVQHAARCSGTIGGTGDKMVFSIERSSCDVPMSDALRASGEQKFSMGQKVSMSPTFGGEGVPTTLVPGQYRVETPAVKTTDGISALGKLGDIQISRGMKWNMTTWAVAWNNREGWGWHEMYSSEDAAESQYYVGKDEKTYTPAAIKFSVSRGVVEGNGTLRTERTGEAPVDTSFMRRYSVIANKGAVKVEEQFGQQKMEFVIYPGE